MSKILERRRFLKGVGACSLLVAPLGGPSAQETGEGNQPHYVMVFDQNKCVGCGDCKLACNKVNELPEGVSRVLLEQQSGRIEGQPCPHCGKMDCDCERRFVRVSCQQCKNAPCVAVCPTGAAHRDPRTGIVTMDTSKCAGCKYCITACPYNARFIDTNTDAASNCDFCLHTKLTRGELPACVQACRYDALVFGDANDPNSYVSRLLAVKDSVRIKAYLGTEPSLRYIPIVKLGV
ncbi:4Fe-4S dicluster domain-containing protein [Shewanella sp. GXUN23E]|uniref:4Fe-4S dicluster domain-containing protein n=1 Tax=Shewanella sp. GXUN23E TaxID=3422498 RepID=UPI003D7E7250